MNQAAFDPGCVRIALSWRDGRAAAVAVELVRPDIAAFFCGRAADAVASQLPMLYSVCGRAQGLAARLVLAAARGAVTEPAVDPAVLAEARRERLMRLLLDWPRALGLPERADLLAEGVRRTADPAFADWAAERLEAHLAALAAAAGDAEGILPAFAADLGRAEAVPLAPGAGRARVMTARGELVHELVLDGDTVADYRLIAPTDRHFAADGPLAATLRGLCADAPESLRGAAELSVLRFDPCVRYEITLCA